MGRDGVKFIAGHKYFSTYSVYSEKATKVRYLLPTNRIQDDTNIAANTWYTMNEVFTNNTNATGRIYYYYNRGMQLSVGDTVYYKNIMIIDLTATFGAGNEPSSVANFKKAMPLPYYETWNFIWSNS